MKSRVIAVMLAVTIITGLNSQLYAAQADFRQKIVENTADTPTYKLNNFLSMRQKLEKLTETEVIGIGGFGTLYTTYEQSVKQKKATDKIYYDLSILHSKVDSTINDNKTKLSQIAASTFSDVKGTEWYAHLIPSAVYYGMISGYSDNTFKGGKNISYAEFSSILGNYNGKKSVVDKGELSGQWYSQTIGVINLDYANNNNLDKNSIHSNISRGEAAMIITNRFFLEELEALDFIIDSEEGKSYFNDSKSIIRLDAKEYSSMKYAEVRQWYLDSKKGDSIPEPVLARMIVLKDKGIMVGDAYGNCNWNKDITRAEVLTLMYKLGCLD